VLLDFFEDKATAAELAQDVAGSISRKSQKVSVVSIAGMDSEFTVSATMLVRLCNVVLQGELAPGALHCIGFALMASDEFSWDDEDNVLADIIGDWSCPEINYPLTLENVRRFRAWLTRSEPYPAKPALKRGGNIVSVTKNNAFVSFANTRVTSS
jgi:hypothetical protein